MYQGFCQSVCQQVAYNDIDSETEQRGPSSFVVLKGKMFIENIAADASEEIVWGRWNPIAQVEDIIEYKHNCSTHDSIDDTYYDELHKGLVSKQPYLIF